MIIVLLAALANFQSTVQFTQPAATQPPFANPIGWKWLLAPIEMSPNTPAPNWEGRAGDAKYSFRRVAYGIVVLNLSTTDHSARSGQDNEYRVVVVAEGYRHNVGPKSIMTSAGGVNYHFRPARVMRPDRPSWVGIEMLTPEGRRQQAADALKRAAAAGVEVLPLPEIGKPLHFKLKSLDGTVVSDDVLRGKVVLIDAWAASCQPCVEKMPRLAELYRQHQADGLEIIGINFDQTDLEARQAIAQHELKWPQVYVPSDDRTRELWYEASSLSHLPRLILLDRQGVVRADVRPDELEDELKQLLPTGKT